MTSMTLIIFKVKHYLVLHHFKKKRSQRIDIPDLFALTRAAITWSCSCF